MMYIWLVVGFVLLIKGADFFVDGSSGVAKKLKVPSIIIGLTIVAMGTSLPECAVSVAAGLRGDNDIALSNIIGSNVFNLLVVCGICAMIKPLPIEISTLKKEFPFSIFIEILLLFLSADYLLHGKTAICVVSRLDGILLLVLFACFMFWMIQSALIERKNTLMQESSLESTEDKDTQQDEKELSIVKCIFAIVLGAVAIKFGGDLVVDSASDIAATFGLSQNLIGLTIVAMGTSLPELVTSIVASSKGEIGMAVGNVVGSNIFNVLMVLGISASLSPIQVGMKSIYDLIFLCISSILVWGLAYRGKKIVRMEGCLMVAVYAIYMVYVCIR